MFTLLIGFSWLAVLLDIGLFALAILFTEKELFPMVLLEVVAIPVALYFFWNVNLIPLILASIPQIIFGFLAYVLVGVVWSCIKWWFYARKNQDKVDDAWKLFKDSYQKSNFPGKAETPLSDIKKEFVASSVYNPLYRGRKLNSDNNWRIVNWVVLWPLSFVWSGLRSITVDFGNIILILFGKVYDKLSNNSFANLN